MATKPSWTVVTQRLKFFARESFLSSLLSFPELKKAVIHSGDFHEFLMEIGIRTMKSMKNWGQSTVYTLGQLVFSTCFLLC